MEHHCFYHYFYLSTKELEIFLDFSQRILRTSRYLPSRQISPDQARLITLLEDFRAAMYCVFTGLSSVSLENSNLYLNSFCCISFSNPYARASSTSSFKTELILSTVAKVRRRSPNEFTNPWTWKSLHASVVKSEIIEK